jgi:hypothetical protein
MRPKMEMVEFSLNVNIPLTECITFQIYVIYSSSELKYFLQSENRSMSYQDIVVLM